MTTPMEKALYRRSFGDGWIDILTGLGLTGVGLCWISGQIALTALVPAVLIPFWAIGRRSLVHPRLETPEFREGFRKAGEIRLTGWAIFGAVVFLTELVIFVAASRQGGDAPALARDYAVALPMLLIAIGLLAGLMIGARRFLAYAAAALLIGGTGAWLQVEEPGLLIAALGCVILLTGLGLLIRFVRAYPLESGVRNGV